MKIFGMVLFLSGALALGTGSITCTHRKELVDAGNVHITRDDPETTTIPMPLAIAALVAGLGLMIWPKPERMAP